MRIMHISTRLILGGSQENTVLSCEGQAEGGHDVSLVHGPIYGPEGSLQVRAAAHGGIELIESGDLCRDLAPLRDRRCLRNLESMVRSWAPDVVHTHSSKAGILGLTRVLALDYGPDIRVNAVLPGAILTPLWKGVSRQDRTRFAEMVPAKRVGAPEDIAHAVLFLASDEASFITGTSLVVDGGLLARTI